MMFFLIADVVYHPFEILRAETHNAITSLPIQQFAIRQLVINVVRTGAFELSNPIRDQQRWRDCNRDVDVGFSAADLVEDQTSCLYAVTSDVAMKSWLDCR